MPVKIQTLVFSKVIKGCVKSWNKVQNKIVGTDDNCGRGSWRHWLSSFFCIQVLSGASGYQANWWWSHFAFLSLLGTSFTKSSGNTTQEYSSSAGWILRQEWNGSTLSGAPALFWFHPNSNPALSGIWKAEGLTMRTRDLWTDGLSFGLCS